MSYRLQSFSPLRQTVIYSSHYASPRFLLVHCCGDSKIRNHIEMKPLDTPTEEGEVVVGDPHSLRTKISAIQLAGPAKLQVIADFDATLTRYWVNGIRGQSSHALLQQGSPEFDAKRQQLYDHYYPLEVSSTIPIDEKTKLMEDWWRKTHALLIEGGLFFDAIGKSVANSNIAFRDGVVELFEFLEERNIPVLIFSAGLADIIEEVLRQKLHKSFRNVKIVSNRMLFDDCGRLVSFKGKIRSLVKIMNALGKSLYTDRVTMSGDKIFYVRAFVEVDIGKTIHVLNKNEHALEMVASSHLLSADMGILNSENALMRGRTNVLLLGDHIGDLGMSDGLNFENRISIAFLNDNVETSLDCYRKAFDTVYLNDAPMWGVLNLASQLCTGLPHNEDD